MTRFISRQEAREIDRENRYLKIIIAVLVALLAIACGAIYSQHRKIEMTEYALENDCEWYYGYYLDEQPICK